MVEHVDLSKEKGSIENPRKKIGSATDVHPLVIKSKRTSDNALGVRERVERGESPPGIAEMRSTRKSI